MRRFLTAIFAIFIASSLNAQDTNVEYVKDGELVKAIYYYEDGSVQQEGTFKDNVLHGQWVSYDTTGNKLAVGNYTDGLKTGKWFFWVNNTLKEVDYLDSKIISVNEWNDKSKVAVRFKK